MGLRRVVYKTSTYVFILKQKIVGHHLSFVINNWETVFTENKVDVNRCKSKSGKRFIIIFKERRYTSLKRISTVFKVGKLAEKVVEK